jgi:hypothetical protein
MQIQTEGTIDLAKAALQYGPFLFAIIFILVVPPYAHAIWRRSFKATADADELSRLLRESRLYFRSSWLFGMFLVLCSILWWAYTQNLDLSTHAYAGFITGLHPEDQLLSISPDDNEYLVPANIDGNIQYRFVYVSPRRINDTIDLRVSYVNNKATPAPEGKGVPTLLILFKLKAGQPHYKFVVDPNSGAMVVPVDWSPAQ